MKGPIPTRPEAARPAPTLATRVEENLDHRGAGLPVALVSRVVSEVAAELDGLHEAGRAHGDVQASQIALPARGPARLREPALAAPFSSASVGGDVAGLVAAAYFAFCGVTPSYFHPLSSLHDEAASRADSSVLVSPSLHRADLPAPVADVLIKGLSPLAANRYATAGAFAAALREAAGVSPPAAASTSGRRRLLLPAALAACAALGAGVWLDGHFQSHPSPAAVSVAVPSVVPPTSPPASSPAPAFLPPPPTEKTPSTPETSATPRPTETQKPSPAVASKTPTPPVPPLTSTANMAGTPGADTVPPQPDVLPKRLVAVPKSVTRLKPPAPPGFLRVYARQFLSAGDVLQRRVSPVRARRVLVDGSPSQSLAAGRWTRLTPGRHKLAFYPVAGVPFDPNTAFWISLKPSRRQAFQVPLPRHPGGIQGFVAKKRPVSSV